MLKKNSISLLTLVVIVFLHGCAVTNTNPAVQILFNKLIETSVEVLADGKMQGSGAFVSSDGYILTAAHYITSPSIKLEVLYGNKQRSDAQLIAIDKGSDIALLKIESKNELPYLNTSSQSPKAGQDIYIVGSPLFKHKLLLKGIVSSSHLRYQYLDDQSSYLHISYIQTMASRGLSGGCWVNSDGEIVGVQSGFINDRVSGTDGHANSGIAFISGQEEINSLVSTKKHAQATSLGGQLEEFWTQSPNFQKRFAAGTEGIVICSVRDGGPLAQAGFTKDSVITEAAGIKVQYINEIMAIVRAKRPNENISITCLKPDNKGFETKDVILDCITSNWLETK